MQTRKISKGFTLIEILVVVIIIVIFVFFAYPNLSRWTSDRDVSNEVDRFVKYFNKKNSEVQSGKYGIYLLKPGMNSKATNKNYYLTPAEFNIQNKAGKFSSRACPGGPGSWGDWKEDKNIFRWSSDVNMWMNKTYCLSPGAIMNPGELEHTVEAGQMSFILCSSKNTDDHNSATNETRCNFSNKKEGRYAVGIMRDLSIVVYKYDSKKDKWSRQ